MALRITQVDLSDFRNWERFCIEPHQRLTIFVGPNAIGKTSILEAIQIAVETVSFRRPAWTETVKKGRPEARVVLEAKDEARLLTIEVSLSAQGRRTYKVNGKVRRRLSDVAGIIPCVLFTPDDLRLVKDSADKRRSAVDSAGVQLSSSYSKIRADYDKVVRQRNALLKEPVLDEASLQSWTERMVDLGSHLITHKRRLFSRIENALVPIYSELAQGENIQATYLPSWVRDGILDDIDDPTDAMWRSLQIKNKEERIRKTSLVGPHRDDIAFFIDGSEARAYASQGQQRTIALAWKLAEVDVIRQIGPQTPVLLLDDVMSELDESRRKALMAFVGSTSQTFITTTNLEYFDSESIEDALVVDLS